MNTGFKIFIIFSALLNFSCTSQKIIKIPADISPDEILHQVIERDTRIKSLRGEGTVTFESPDFSNSGFFTARLKKPDSLLFEVHGPFGIRVATLSISGDNYIFYDWLENKSMSGNTNEQTFMTILHVPLDFFTVFRIFTGAFFENKSEQKIVKKSSNESSFHLTCESADGVHEYWIDYPSMIVTGYKHADNQGKYIISASVSEIDEVNDIFYGKLIRIFLPQTKQSVTIAYDHVDFNSKFNCSFNLPQKSKNIY